jgi:3-deoxy-manno-octulosonate cytidylyltransferase (CMP-KDO synthetase)
VKGADRVVVATDDARIREECEGFGAEVAMTPAACANGTERCAAAHEALGGGYDIIVNLQGDAPLTPPWFVTALIEAMVRRPGTQVATPVLRCDRASMESFLNDRAEGRVGATTAVFNANGDALYFSKEVIPYTGRALSEDETVPVFHHVGVYAYRSAALAAYPRWEAGPLERWEGLEQLRFLEQGTAIACVEVHSRGAQFWELNNPVDVGRIEAMLKAAGIP